MPGYRIREYLDPKGESPFSRWLVSLKDIRARARIRIRLDRARLGNLGDFKAVGGGVFEFRLDLGPGYRIYFGFSGKRELVLLGGGTKHRQRRDIETALRRWVEINGENDS